jgi:four helix bundle protein
MPLHAETNALELYRSLVAPLAKLRMTDPKLAEDARRAVRSIVENTGEGAGRFGRDRPHHFSIAYGSGRELRNQLAIAEIDGGLSTTELEKPRALLERELRLLWGLTRHRR